MRWLLLLAVLGVAGCSDSLRPGTERMLSASGATSVTVKNLEAPIGDPRAGRGDVEKGTRVRIIGLAAKPRIRGDLEVRVLEGPCKDMNYIVRDDDFL